MALRDARSIRSEIHPPAPAPHAPLSAEFCYPPETHPISSRDTSPSRIASVTPFTMEQAQIVSTAKEFVCSNINNRGSFLCCQSDFESSEQTVMRPSTADRSSAGEQTMGTIRRSIDSATSLHTSPCNTVPCAAYDYTKTTHIGIDNVINHGVDVWRDAQKKGFCQKIGSLNVPGLWRGTPDNVEKEEERIDMTEACNKIMQLNRVQHDIDITRQIVGSLSNPADLDVEFSSNHKPGTPEEVFGYLPTGPWWLSSLYSRPALEAGPLLRRNRAVHSRDAPSRKTPHTGLQNDSTP